MRTFGSLLATLSLAAFVAGVQVQDTGEGMSAIDMPTHLADEGADAMCGRCGDGVCVSACGENALSCPKDCGVDS